MKRKAGNTKINTKQKNLNFEALLLMAKYDKGFRKLLLRDHKKAITKSGLKFTDQEKKLLDSISNEELLNTVKSFTIPGVKKHLLSNWKKAAAVLFLLTSISQGYALEASYKSSFPQIIINKTERFFHRVFRDVKQHIITGTVTDADTQVPLPGTNVLIKGTTTKTIADLDGNYSINVSSDDTLVFSFDGYTTVEVHCDDLTSIDIELIPELLDEDIIIISYGNNPSSYWYKKRAIRHIRTGKK